MNALSRIYSLSFFLLLLALGAWAAKWEPSPSPRRPFGMTAPARTADAAPSPSRPRRRFAFQPGGELRLAAPALAGSDRYDYYAALCAHFGREPVTTTVLGLRGLAPGGERHASGDNMSNYDDTFVVLRPGQRTAREFLGSTHAGQATSSLSPRGVAQIQPGIYRAEPSGDFNGMASWWVTNDWGNGRIPCWRDADGDGFIDNLERGRPSVATEILFHNGRYSDYGTSIGCQVLSPKAMRNFITTVGSSEPFDYVLVDANRPIPAIRRY